MSQHDAQSQPDNRFTAVGSTPSDFPFRIEEWEELARNSAPREAYDYAAGGSGAEQTMRRNVEAFSRWAILPRTLRDVSERSSSITLLGQQYAAPIFLAPIGMQRIIHPEGELASSRAAAKQHIPFVTSTVSSYSLEEIAEQMGDSPRWFQLYWSNDREISASMVRRAEQTGYSAIVLTVDTIMLGWKVRDLRNGYSPLKLGMGMANYITDPVFTAKYGRYPEITREEVVAAILENVYHPSLSLDDLRFLREQTKLPIAVKGILHPDDARACIEAGADAVIVSNHGGRQLDGAAASIEALPGVVQAVQGRVPVILDSGVRTGSDVIKALALGASAVFYGRPYLYGLAVAGERGVDAVIRNLLAEFDISLALSGCRTPAELDASILHEVS
jgi:isopentenyl diphosphate isomerase/L-lactate dehydrogenase-like FMN-dependent dehydrogenase